MHRILTRAIFATLALAFTSPAPAQIWPSQPVRIVVGFSPGGSSDLIARLLAPEIALRIGGTVLVENKPGAASTLGSDYVAKSPPDGHTIYVTNVSATGMAPSIYKNLPYDPVKDFAQVAMVGYVAAVLLVDPKLPIQDLKDYVAYVKARPGKVNFGTGGHGTMNHVAGEMLNAAAGIDAVHVPYRGSAEATRDMMASVIAAQFDALNQNISRIEAGTVRALAITTPERSRAAPNIPTFKELGYPGIVALNWNGLAVPAKTPPQVVKKLSDAVQEAMALPEVRAKFDAWGMTPAAYNPEQTTRFVQDEVAMWRSVITKSKAFH